MTEQNLTPPQIAHAGSGFEPHKYKDEPYTGHCATCGAAVDGQAVPIAEIENPTFSNHADFMRFGKHVCPACAWLYGAGKGKPGNFMATPNRYEQLVISLDSVVEDKRPWLEAVRDLAALPSDTPVCGVLTTDIKPRLWPRMAAGTAAVPNLFVHAPDYDLSKPVSFALSDLLDIIETVLQALSLGFSKTNCYRGLPHDYARYSKHLAAAHDLERRLKPLRDNPAFIPAVLTAGIKKGSKK